MKKKIAPDKWKHFFAGILMGAVLQSFFWWLVPSGIAMPIILALFFVVSISYGFELFSKFTGMGHYDVMDAVASVIGGVSGMAPVIILQVCLN